VSGRILAVFLAMLLMTIADAAEPTRVVQAEEILKKIELGQPVEYDNVIVEGDLDLSGLDLPRVPVKRTFIEKLLRLPDYYTLVVSPIRLTNSVIRDSIDFNSTFFQNVMDFSGTRFEGPAIMFCLRLRHTADFEDVRFNETADFGNARFNEAAEFWNSWFNGTAEFWNAQFNQTADFENVRFNETADFGNARFNETGKFWNARFNQESHFKDASFLNVFFNNSQFSKEAFFQGAKINGTLSLYRTKYDTLNIRWSSIHDLAYDDTAYHLLIQNFNKLGFGDDARECQYSYRCKHREELFRQDRFDSWLFDLLAWASYGYGLRPVRPLGWAALFIFIGGVFFFLTGSVARSKESPYEKRPLALRKREEKPEGIVSIWEAILLSATYFTSGASSIISATPTEFVPLGRGRYVVVILRLLGWIFFVLFLSSLTRTV